MVRLIRARLPRPIVDATGLTGTFTFSLDFDALSGVAGPDAAGRAGAGPSIFTAVEEQLGLKLVSAREDMDVLVIDHIEPPSEN